MAYSHIALKPTKRINTDFDIQKATKEIEIPEKSKNLINDYHTSKKLSDEYGQDLMLAFERALIYGFDYRYKQDKIFIPELNPVTVFFSNATMSLKKLIEYREILFSESPSTKDFQKNVDLKLFGNFFQLSSNCLFNLQASLESYANWVIPEEYKTLDKNGEEIYKPSLTHKIFTTLPELKKKHFKKHNRKGNFVLVKIIELRNDIVHLKPIKDKTNTKYKKVYRKLLQFNFADAIKVVRDYINFFEPNLIEDCNCGNEFYFDINVLTEK
jgi:hypothetical protein